MAQGTDAMHVLDARDAQQGWDLDCNDANSRSSHETIDSRGGDKFHNPSDPQNANAEDDESAQKCQVRSNERASPRVGELLIDCLDDLGNCQSNDSDRSNRDISGGRKELLQTQHAG